MPTVQLMGSWDSLLKQQVHLRGKGHPSTW